MKELWAAGCDWKEKTTSPVSTAMYRPHRSHRPQRLNFQIVLAVALFLIIARERVSSSEYQRTER